MTKVDSLRESRLIHLLPRHAFRRADDPDSIRGKILLQRALASPAALSRVRARIAIARDVTMRAVDATLNALEVVVILVNAGWSRKLAALQICGGIALARTCGALLMSLVTWQ